MKASDVLRGAKGVLQRQGWRQRECGTARGPIGLLGACAVAAGVKDLPGSAIWGVGAALNDVEKRVLPHLRHAIGSEFVCNWNNAHGRTLDDVLAAIDRAIVLAEADEAEPAKAVAP